MVEKGLKGLVHRGDLPGVRLNDLNPSISDHHITGKPTELNPISYPFSVVNRSYSLKAGRSQPPEGVVCNPGDVSHQYPPP